MIKKTLVLLLLVVAGAVLFYQNSLLLEAQHRLREVEDWVERKKVEDSLAKEMEGKRRNQEFIMQMDYQVQLQDLLGSKLSAVDEEIAQVKNEGQALAESRFNQLQESLDKLERKNSGRSKELQQLNETQKQRLDELEASFKEQLKAAGQAQSRCLEQIKFLKQEMEKMRQKQAKLEAKINAGTSVAP